MTGKSPHDFAECLSMAYIPTYLCRLLLCGVVRESGYIFKCFDEVCGDFVISDELRKVSLYEDALSLIITTSSQVQ